jgi:hypothetical protein
MALIGIDTSKGIAFCLDCIAIRLGLGGPTTNEFHLYRSFNTTGYEFDTLIHVLRESRTMAVVNIYNDRSVDVRLKGRPESTLKELKRLIDVYRTMENL